MLIRVAERRTGLTWRHIAVDLGRVHTFTLTGTADTVTQTTPLHTHRGRMVLKMPRRRYSMVTFTRTILAGCANDHQRRQPALGSPGAQRRTSSSHRSAVARHRTGTCSRRRLAECVAHHLGAVTTAAPRMTLRSEGSARNILRTRRMAAQREDRRSATSRLW